MNLFDGSKQFVFQLLIVSYNPERNNSDGGAFELETLTSRFDTLNFQHDSCT